MTSTFDNRSRERFAGRSSSPVSRFILASILLCLSFLGIVRAAEEVCVQGTEDTCANRLADEQTTGLNSIMHETEENVTSEPRAQMKPSEVVYGSDDKLFGWIEHNHAATGTSFGRFLDAGTGKHSISWIASLLLPPSERKHGTGVNLNLSIEDYTAITADETMRKGVLKEVQALGIEGKGSIVVGNWNVENFGNNKTNDDIELCHGEMYDTILADYLVGAMDGFSPYYQDQIFPRLSKHLKPGGRIYVVGLDPIPYHAEGEDADVYCKVSRLRDACLLLAGRRCYREYPKDWIERHLEKAGLKVESSEMYPIKYSHAKIMRQLNFARGLLSEFPSDDLAHEMNEVMFELEVESWKVTSKSPDKRLELGFDYVVSAVKPLEDEQ